MSLSINVTASNSSNNLHHFQPKPMAISSITSSTLPSTGLMSSSPTETISSSLSSSLSSHKMNSKSPSPPFVLSTPSSPEILNFNSSSGDNSQRYNLNRHSYQPPSSSYPFQHDDQIGHYTTQKHHHGLYRSNSSHQGAMFRYSSTPASRSSSISSVLCSSTSPLSLQERRQRNKAASAKYRAKKNQQHGEMRMMISTLTKENDLLQRQLDHVKRENERLKVTCDKYRGKILAEKMLKKLLNTSQQDELEQTLNQVSSDDEDDMNHDELMEEQPSRQRFEEDIEFEEDFQSKNEM